MRWRAAPRARTHRFVVPPSGGVELARVVRPGARPTPLCTISLFGSFVPHSPPCIEDEAHARELLRKSLRAERRSGRVVSSEVRSPLRTFENPLTPFA